MLCASARDARALRILARRDADAAAIVPVPCFVKFSKLCAKKTSSKTRITGLECMPTTFITKPEIEKILGVAFRSKRDHLMLLLSFAHALRASEVAALRLSDLHGGNITVARLKGSLTTTQALLRSNNILFDEVTALDQWLRERGVESGPLLTARKGSTAEPLTRQWIYKLERAYMLEAGITPKLAHPHSLKHAAISHMIRNGARLDTAKQFAGHKSITSTIIYTNTSDSEAMDAFASTLGTSS